jgi:hypothetical protein
VTVILGAGASLANALHFRPTYRRDTHPPLDTTFFEKFDPLNIYIPPELRAYIGVARGRGDRMEDLFKDVFFDFQSANRSQAVVRAYSQLVQIYTRILRETTNWLCEDGRNGAPIGKLIAKAADAADAVTIITFNHDLVIENEIHKRARLRSRWCIEQGYGAFGDQLQLISSGTADDFPRHGSSCDHARPISILKMHGSLNWVVRMQGQQPSARILLGEGPQRDILLTRRRFIVGRLRYSLAGRRRGRTKWYTWPVVVPPIYTKQQLIRSMEPVWDDARSAVATCNRLIVFGYSLPGLDIDAEKLVERGLASNKHLPWVDVINPDPHAASRYASLNRNGALRWYSSPEAFLRQDDLEA